MNVIQEIMDSERMMNRQRETVRRIVTDCSRTHWSNEDRYSPTSFLFYPSKYKSIVYKIRLYFQYFSRNTKMHFTQGYKRVTVSILRIKS